LAKLGFAYGPVNDEYGVVCRAASRANCTLRAAAMAGSLVASIP